MEQYILQDVLKNTSLLDYQISCQLEEIENSFRNDRHPSNELYSYLAKHHSQYLRSLYHKNVSVADRESFGRSASSNTTHDLLLHSYQPSIFNEALFENDTKVPDVPSTPQEFNSNSTEQHTSFGIGSDTTVDTTPSSTVISDFSTSVSSPAYDTNPSSFD